MVVHLRLKRWDLKEVGIPCTVVWLASRRHPCRSGNRQYRDSCSSPPLLASAQRTSASPQGQSLLHTSAHERPEHATVNVEKTEERQRRGR